MERRVHKAVGFGLDDFQAPDNFNDQISALDEMTVGEFVAWSVIYRDTIETLAGVCNDGYYRAGTSFQWELERFQNSLKDPRRSVVWNPEFGMKDVVLFIPLSVCREEGRSWYRYNDTLDWVEEAALRHKCNWCQEVSPQNLYPYYINGHKGCGDTPISVAAIMLFLGIEDQIKNLKGLIYVYWAPGGDSEFTTHGG
ncbi:MAG: hypothetical protein UY48_C0005G0011 [Candidatus Gottesmanbacteria bacterium GW2011_GWB1_49_7]|uniref:Uncharacterized protein n=1 Tax=Candidatus Gottesmanbacteria bacterium GW2011_GWB1_49_7 TaxID=1618448 RepID=A0A0G1W392_9BACT|nr:MAG: hypothetical protein UY48_C0005G0011 [Candidatus Gottesmanbacteria bacterium GW2011_GWB1_49_7]